MTRIRIKNDTFSNLSSVVLALGEPAYATDLKLLKFGDGVNTFEDIASPPSEASIYYVHNDTGSTIYKGQATYASGVKAHGKIIKINKYISDGSIQAIRFLGLAKEDIAHGADGEIVHFGHVSHVDTSNLSRINNTGADFSEGDILYVSDLTAGELTTTKPSGIDPISVAFVLSSGNQGEVFVRPNVEHGVRSDTASAVSSYSGGSSAVASGVYNIVIVNQDTYDNITKDPNTIYFVP